METEVGPNGKENASPEVNHSTLSAAPISFTDGNDHSGHSPILTPSVPDTEVILTDHTTVPDTEMSANRFDDIDQNYAPPSQTYDNNSRPCFEPSSQPSKTLQVDDEKLVDNGVLPVPSPPVSEQTPLSNVKKSEQHTYTCSCGKSFSKSTDLAAHKRWTCKMAEKRCQCEVCKGWFAHEQGLQRHMKHAHGGKFPCDSCSLLFHSKMKLTHHWMEVHYDEKHKVLKCYICDANKFDSKYDLECHLLAHKYARERGDIPTIADQDTLTAQSRFSFHTSSPSLYSSNTSTTSPSRSDDHWRHHNSQSPFSHHCRSHGPYNFLTGHSHLHSGAQHTDHMFVTHPSHSLSDTQHTDHMFAAHPSHSHSDTQHTGHMFATHPWIPPPPPPPPPLPPPAPPPASQFPSQPPPHHDHELPQIPPYHAYPYLRKFYKHYHKMNLKHYFKTMMSHDMPLHWARRSGFRPCHVGSNDHKQNTPGVDMIMRDAVTCDFCGKTIPMENIVRHKRRGCPVLCVHKCDTCGKAFGNEGMLIRHMNKSGHVKRSDSTRQSDSSIIAGLQNKLETVLNFQKVDKTENESQNLNDSIRDPAKVKATQSSCSSKTLDNVSSNIDTSVGDQASSYISKFTENAFEEDGGENILIIDESTSKLFQCNVCRLTVRSKSNLQQHLQDHVVHVESIQKVQEWTERSAGFFSDPDEAYSAASSGISTELSSTSGVPSELDGCSNISSHISTLNSFDKWLKPHGKHKHTKHKRQIFPCDICDEKFAFRKDLKFHMKEKHKDCSLECPICHKKFKGNKAMFYERHMNSHYGVSVFKYKCDVCNKTFLEKHKFQAHMSKHKSELLHTCSTCGKGYGNKSSLIRHQRKHTGDKPHQCETCNECFWEKRELIRHSASHTGAAPFVCPDCGQGFTLKTSLVKHVKRKHS